MLILILAIVLLILFLLWCLLLKPRRGQPGWEPFARVRFAHRGLHDLAAAAPENSLAAFRRAAEAAPPFPALEEAIPAVELGGSGALATAVQNDIGAEWVFAQQVYGLGTAGDVLIALSTSGNSQNVLRAAETARAKGIFTVAFTGRGGGKLSACCDVLLNVPAEETFAVQELHLPLYHLLCAAAESERWG